MTTTMDRAIQTLNLWLSGIGARENLQLTLNDNLYCPLKLDNQHEAILQLNPSGDSVTLVSYIGQEVYRKNAEEVLKELLMFNFQDNQLNGCYFCLCKSTQQFALRLDLPMAILDEQILLNTLHGFTQTVNQGLEKIQTLQKQIERQSELPIDRWHQHEGIRP